METELTQSPPQAAGFPTLAVTIQQVAQQTRLSIDTLRYYERIGLLEPVGRAQNGHRRYTQHDLAWIDLLIRLRDTGMPRAQVRNPIPF